MTPFGPTAVLLVTCADQKGLVATASDFIYRNNGNIVHADQHTDAQLGIFLQRIEWEMDGFRLSRDELTKAFEPIAQRFRMVWGIYYSDYRPRIALLVSKEAHCMYDLLARQRMGEFEADIPIVVSNHEDLAPVAETFGVKYACVANTGAGGKTEQEARVRALLQAQRVDLVVLARYMQVLSPDFVQSYDRRIINIHHSFLPAFVGARPYQQAHERGVKIIGATAHYVTEALDEGPIIEQDVVRVSHRDTVGDLVRKGKDLEKVVLARAVTLHLNHQVMVYGNKTVVFG